MAQPDSDCPLKDCDGSGHITGSFSFHKSIFSCPRIARTLNKSTHKCPTPGCNGKGSSKSLYTTHRQVLRCPLIREQIEQYKGLLTIGQFEDILNGKALFPSVERASNGADEGDDDVPMNLSKKGKTVNTIKIIKPSPSVPAKPSPKVTPKQSKSTTKATKPTPNNRRTSTGTTKSAKQKAELNSPKPDELSPEFLDILSNCDLEPLGIDQLRSLVQQFDANKTNIEKQSRELDEQRKKAENEFSAAQTEKDELKSKYIDFITLCSKIDPLNGPIVKSEDVDLFDIYLERIESISKMQNQSKNDRMQYEILRKEFKEYF